MNVACPSRGFQTTSVCSGSIATTERTSRGLFRSKAANSRQCTQGGVSGLSLSSIVREVGLATR